MDASVGSAVLMTGTQLDLCSNPTPNLRPALVLTFPMEKELASLLPLRLTRDIRPQLTGPTGP